MSSHTDAEVTAVRPARLFLVDDHRVIRLGLRQLLAHIDGLALAGEAASGEEALEKLSEIQADVALVDLALGGMNGIELTRRMKRNWPEVRVLVVSAYADTIYVRQAIEAGADGYVLKNKIDELLEEATATVLDGRRYFCNGVQDAL